MKGRGFNSVCVKLIYTDMPGKKTSFQMPYYLLLFILKFVMGSMTAGGVFIIPFILLAFCRFYHQPLRFLWTQAVEPRLIAVRSSTSLVDKYTAKAEVTVTYLVTVTYIYVNTVCRKEK